MKELKNEDKSISRFEITVINQENNI